MCSGFKQGVLKCFKSLHRARQRVFQGDQFALEKSRERINEEFKKHMHITNAEKIRSLVDHSRAVEKELLTNVVQAKEIAPGRYEVHLRPEVERLKNVPFKDVPG